MTTQRAKRGFTLVELLVVIAIIGILIALLLPAVQAAREAARRSQCSNNLKQIGLALHYYHDSNNAFPFTYWHAVVGSTTMTRSTVLARLLPYLEQRALYDCIDFRINDSGQKTTTGTQIQTVPVAAFLCPSDSRVTGGLSPTGYAFTNYAPSAGPTRESIAGASNCRCDALPWYNYWNSLGYPSYSDSNPAGPFCRKLSSGSSGSPCMCRMADVTDGLSNTIFFGEVRAGCSGHLDRYGWFLAAGMGMNTTLFPINFDTCHEQSETLGEDRKCNYKCTWNSEFAFRSAHPGGAGFLLGDGSVQFLSETIDFATYQYLGAKADGQPVNMP